MKGLALIFLLALVSCAHHSSLERAPAAAGDDPCKLAMSTLIARSQGQEGAQFVDEIIDANRLIDQGFLTGEDLRQIETSSEWHSFFLNSQVAATSEEQILVAALLRKSDPSMPVEALQRKYNLLFEFCGL